MDTHCHWSNCVLRNNETFGETGYQTETKTIYDAPLFNLSILQLLLMVGLY